MSDILSEQVADIGSRLHIPPPTTLDDLTRLIERSGDALVLLDSQWRYLYLNANAERLYRCAAADVLGKRVWDWFPDTHSGEFQAAARQAMQGLDVAPCTLFFPETHVWCECRFHPVSGRLLLLMRDVSGRKAWEQERQRLLHAAHSAERDPLTGLPDHRAFYQYLHVEAERARRECTPVTVAMLDIDDFKAQNEMLGREQGDEVLRQTADALRRCFRPYDVVARIGGDEFAVALPGMNRADAERLFQGSRLTGLRNDEGEGLLLGSSDKPVRLSLGFAVYPEESETLLAALALADERLYRSKRGSRGQPGTSASASQQPFSMLPRDFPGFDRLDALVTAIDSKDRYTRRHSEEVAEYARAMARQMQLSQEETVALEVAALLHDVGKIGVPDHILRRPSHLTDDEFEGIKQHPALGGVMVESMLFGGVPADTLEQIVAAVRHHHEAWDGSGYPDGLAEDNIPLLARILAVADAFSAMTTDRPYRGGSSARQAKAILLTGAGLRWDARCVAAFIASFPENSKRLF